MKKILLSVLTIAAVSAIGVAATRAFFSDVETSEGNTFTAGSLDLKVDSECSYNGGASGQCGTWELKDLNSVTDKFFNFTDVKPGDFGENTISLHVGNDAWLRLVIDGIENDDNTCTEPESLVDPDGLTCGTAGELQQNLLFSMWLDQGVTPGFQGPQDLSECDNDRPNIEGIDQMEPMIITEGPIDPQGETWNLADYQGSYLKGGETACFGVAWKLPSETGDEVQSDSFEGDMTFQVEQYRNNPTPFPTP